MEAKTKVVVFETKLWSSPGPTCVVHHPILPLFIFFDITCPKTARWLLEELVEFRKKTKYFREKHNI